MERCGMVARYCDVMIARRNNCDTRPVARRWLRSNGRFRFSLRASHVHTRAARCAPRDTWATVLTDYDRAEGRGPLSRSRRIGVWSVPTWNLREATPRERALSLRRCVLSVKNGDLENSRQVEERPNGLACSRSRISSRFLSGEVCGNCTARSHEWAPRSERNV